MTNKQSYENLVTCTVDQGVAVITWNRPDRNNAWTIPMENRYFDLLQQCASDPEVRAIVVTGAGKSFCPGLDSQALDDISSGADFKPQDRRPMTYATSIPKPIIAAINGACAGIGLLQALACDIRFVADTARLSTAYARRGILAEHGSAWLMPRVVGWANAMDLLFSGRIVDAEEAKELGLVNRISQRDTVVTDAIAYARELATWSSPLAMGIMKHQLYASQTMTLDESRLEAISLWHERMRSHADFKEGVNSLIEKRAPEFAPWSE